VSSSTPEEPWPVRTVARKIAEWIHRLGDVWVEGQITQISARPGTATAFLTLRDPSSDVSLSLTCASSLLRNSEARIEEGSQVIVHGKPTFYTGRGTLSLRIDEIRSVGIGELLARIERLRKVLHAEGLFDPRLKRKLPFVPNKIGLITGRASAAERDVLENASRRWPAVQFEVRNVAVQGASAVPQVVAALQELDKIPDVDVIIIARGGGSVEDLLPFSDETLCREVAKATTPIISAIGHEPDAPLLDYVADVRCSTPTDAAKRVVPDMAEETHRIDTYRQRARRTLSGWVDREQRLLTQLRSRPALADPLRLIVKEEDRATDLLNRNRRAVQQFLSLQETKYTATAARLKTLGPAATLARGYSVVQIVADNGETTLLHEISQASKDNLLRIRVTDGALHAIVTDKE
jgi:exodeoxyribonuclease VII large subunit